jgi:hypothetical protein
MTRVQIVKMTSATARLVELNKAGVAPPNQKHVARLQELKRAQADEKARLARNGAVLSTDRY